MDQPGSCKWPGAAASSRQWVGLKPDELTSIFELFVQGDTSLARSQGGLGIGLTLVRQLIELHGGRVEARNPGLVRGAIFSLSTASGHN